MQQGNFINVFFARHVSGTYTHHQEHQTSCSIWFSAPSFRMGGGLESRCVGRPTQWLSSPPPIQKLGAENHMLQLNVWCSWWWAYVPETCRAKNTLIKLPFCIVGISNYFMRKMHGQTTLKYVFLWPNIRLNFIPTHQDNTYLSLKNCTFLEQWWAFFPKIDHRLQSRSRPSTWTHL